MEIYVKESERQLDNMLSYKQLPNDPTKVNNETVQNVKTRIFKKYIVIFICKKFILIDYVQIINTSLKHLVNNLSYKGVLKYTSKYFVEIAHLMTRRDVYPHSYLDFYKIFTGKSHRQTYVFIILLTKSISV